MKQIIKKYYLVFIFYFVGVLTPFVIVALFVTFGIKPPKSKFEIMLEKWHITNPNENSILINVPIASNLNFNLGMEYDPNTGWVKEIGMTKVRTPAKNEAFFVFRTKGKYGVPMVYYGCPEQGLVWRDLNFDFRFDQRIDYENELMQININDAWITGTGKAEVKTEKGIFHFDPEIGKWNVLE